MSQGSLRLLFELIKSSSYLRTIPISWNPITRAFITRTSFQCIPTYFYYTIVVLRIIYLIPTFYLYRHLENFQEQFFHINTLFICINTIIFGTVLLKYKHEFVTYINYLIKFRKSDRNDDNSAELFMEIFVLGCLSQFIILSLAFVFKYSKPWYYSSTFGGDNLGWLCVFFIGEIMQHLVTYGVIIPFPTMVCHYFVMTCWLRRIRLRLTKSLELEEDMLALRQTLIIFKELRLLHEGFTQFFSKIYLPLFYLFLINFIVFLIHFLTRYHEILPVDALYVFLSTTVGLILLLTHVFPIGGRISTQSASYLKLTSGMSLNDELKRELRACPVIKVKIGPFVRLEKWTSIQIVGFTFYWTARSFILIKPIDIS